MTQRGTAFSEALVLPPAGRLHQPATSRAGQRVAGRPYNSRQATYDLRRLIRKGLIQRLPGSQRYLLTPLGRRAAVLFTKAYGRILAPGLAALDPALPDELAGRTPLAVAWRGVNHALDTFIDRQVLAA